jgi:threonine/homoserine/homoserine lactone efflux protein
MTLEFILSLGLFAFVSSVTPGPNNLMLMASGANFGFSRTLPHMMGVSIGCVVMILIVGAGLAQVFDRWPVLFTAIKYASIAYLLYLAWKIATSGALSDSKKTASRPFTFFQAAAFQWINPKAWTMALTGLSAYSIEGRPTLTLIAVTIVFGLVNIPSISLWALLGTKIKHWLGAPWRMRAFNYTAAALLVASLWPVLVH